MFDTVESVLEHYGIKGMKWGIRRKRGANGRVGGGKSNTSSSAKKKSGEKGAKSVLGRKKVNTKKVKAKDLSDEDLKAAVNRMQMEKQYNTLVAERATSSQTRGQRFTKAVVKAGVDIGSSQAKRAANAYVGHVIDTELKKKGVKTKKKKNK